MLLRRLLLSAAAALPAAAPALALADQPHSADHETAALQYEADFPGLDRSIVGRADSSAKVLPDNVPQRIMIDANGTVALMFEVGSSSTTTTTTSAGTKATKRAAQNDDDDDDDDEYHELWSPDGLLRRATKTIYITANTCQQPVPQNINVTTGAPQLTLYVSTSADNTAPGPDSTNNTETIPFTQGAVMYETEASGAVYFSVAAAANLTNHTGNWQFEVAASTQGYYHRYVAGEQRLYWIDSDATAGLLTTGNLTTQDNRTLIHDIMTGAPPYAFFASADAAGTTTALDGIRFSYCGLQNYASVASLRNNVSTGAVRIDMTTRSGGYPKQQFYVGNLTARTHYYGIPVQLRSIIGDSTQEFVDAASRKRDKKESKGGNADAAGNYPVGGGGIVYAGTEFDTKEGTTCRIITNLNFCNDTEYAVPSNDLKFNITELADFYDSYAQAKYTVFEKALAQSACDAHPAGQFSLARTCDDCRQAYKQWLCSVVIPRCEDYDSTNLDSHLRNANMSFPNGTQLPAAVVSNLTHRERAPAFLFSRNDEVNSAVQPGPYREILPCDDLCYDIVQSCPSALGFMCPLRGTPQYASSYAQKNNSKTLACNFPGALHQASVGARWGAVGGWAAVVAVVVWGVVV